MFINQFKLVLRRLRKAPFYSLVNLLGLTIGITAVLFIAIYVNDERSYDRFHTDADRIFRLTSAHERFGVSGMTVTDYVEHFAPDMPEVEAYTRLSPQRREVMVSAGDTDLNLGGVMTADPNFFSFFSFNLVDGIKDKVFAETGRAVITRSASNTLFGDQNPIGQEIVIEKGERYVISGLSEDPPGNSTIQYSLLLFKRGFFDNQFEQRHSVRTVITYLKLSHGTGLRKVIGAGRSQLMLYHLLESGLLTLVSFLLAFGLVERLMPVFNAAVGKDIQIHFLNPGWLGFGILFSMVLGVVSGLYPAYYINKVKPLALMNRFATSEKNGKGFKKGLVLFQFVATAILIVTLVIMRQQMNYLEEKDLGFDTELVLSVPLSRDSTHLYSKLKNEFDAIPGVVNTSLTGFRIGGSAMVSVMHGPIVDGTGPGGDIYNAVYADEHLFNTLNIQFYWQSSLWEGGRLKNGEMLVNHSMAEKLGWLGDPTGKKLYDQNGRNGRHVVGIVQDLHIKSLKNKVEPAVIYPLGDWGTNTLLVKLEQGTGPSVVSQMAASFSLLFDRPFSYELLENQVDRFYAKERGQFRLFQVFSSLALFISLLGLFALTIYTLQQRRKEIGIRKVLGASLNGLILMLNREYAVLVVIAFLVATPVAYYGMEQWLADFSYRIELSPVLFVATFLGFLLLCWSITAGLSLRVSGENPADVLREE